MKNVRLISLILLLFVFLAANGQQSKTEVSEEKIKEVIEKVVDEEYIRIPKDDFDEILKNRISNLVGAKINAIIGFTVTAIGLLSALSFFQNWRSKNSLREEIDLKFSSLKSEVNTDLRAYIEDFSKAVIEPRFEYLQKLIDLETKNVKSESETLLVQIQEALIKAKEEQLRARQYIMDSRVQQLQNSIKNRTNKPEDIPIAEKLLNEFMEFNPDSSKITAVVDVLSYMYYDQKAYTQVNDLIGSHKDKNLSSNTYINGALTAIFDYHNYATVEKKEIALDYLDKSLQITQGYGEALGLKLEIFMMDYFRTDKDEVKKEAETQAEIVIDSILNSASNIPAYETISRLSRDFQLASYKELIAELSFLFPLKMQRILELANQYNDQRGRLRFRESDISEEKNIQ